MMERAGAVATAAAEDGEAAVGGDEALLYSRVAEGDGFGALREWLPRRDLGREAFEDGGEEGLDDVAVVVVPVEFRPVAINAVALVPGLVDIDGGSDGTHIGALARLVEGCLNHGGK